MRAEHDQINAHFHGIADDFLGTIAKDDLFASRHLHVFELSAEPGKMIPRRRFDAVVKVALLLNPQPWNDLYDMQQGDLAIAFICKLSRRYRWLAGGYLTNLRARGFS